MTAFTHIFPLKNCNDSIIVCVRCENEIHCLIKLVDVLSFVIWKKLCSYKIKTTLKGRHYHFDIGNVKILDFYAIFLHS